MADRKPHPGPFRGDQPVARVKYGPIGTMDPELFAKTIQAAGLTFWWSRAVECPCRTSTDQFKPVCDRCGGDGWWYISPEARTNRHMNADYIAVKCVFGGGPRVLEWDQFHEFGGWASGEATLTLQHEARVGYRDRFVGVEQVMPRSEVLIRLDQATIPVGKTGRTTEVQKGALRYEPVRINFVADETTVYWEGVDFRIAEATQTEPNRVVWLAGRGPAVGSWYTVHYDCHPVWVVQEATYAAQAIQGPAAGLKGARDVRDLPTTFRVMLDFLTPARGTGADP